MLRVGKVIKEVLSLEHEAKKLSRVLAGSKAAVPHRFITCCRRSPATSCSTYWFTAPKPRFSPG